jgi:hypothetical protein
MLSRNSNDKGNALRSFLELLAVQRWDDHRYYHHSLVNQSLHLVSATCFVIAYGVLFEDPAYAALLAWMISMTSRQIGHFFFEPKDYDVENDASHEFKEEIKVGYNLRRKIVLMAIWALSPLILVVSPTLFGLCEKPPTVAAFARHVGNLWLVIGIAGLLFRTIQLFIIKDVQTGLVWAAKIITDPFHDIMLYRNAPMALLHRRGDEGEFSEIQESV